MGDAFFEAIDRDLGPFLDALDKKRGRIRAPKDIIPREAREMVEEIKKTVAEAVENQTRALPIRDLALEVQRRTGLVFKDPLNRDANGPKPVTAGSAVGFIDLPGVSKIATGDIFRPLQVSFIDFTGENLGRISHWHVGAFIPCENEDGEEDPTQDINLPGAEYTEVWRVGVMETGLSWKQDQQTQLWIPGDGVRISEHGSRDDYSVPSSTTPFIGVYWGGVDFRSKVAPSPMELR